MFFKCSRLVVTSFISLSILFSVVSPADAVKGAKDEVTEDQAKQALRSANKSKNKLKTKPADMPIKTNKENKAPIAAPRTGADSTDTDSSFDSDFRDPASRPDPKPAVANAPVVVAESRKRSLGSLEESDGLDNLLTRSQLRYVIQTTDLVTGRLFDFSPALRVGFGDAKSKAHHQVQIDKSRETLIATLLSYTPDQQPLLLDRFIKFTNGWDFLELDNPQLFIQAGIKAISDIGEVDPESVVRHANKLILTGLFDHTNVSDSLKLFFHMTNEEQSYLASNLWPLLNVSTEAPIDNHEAQIVVRLLQVISTSEIQKIVQKLKAANLFVLPEVPSFDLKFINKDPKDTETIFQIIFTHAKEYWRVYNGPNADVYREYFEDLSYEERARPRVLNQLEGSSGSI